MSIEAIVLDLTDAIRGLTKAIEASRIVPDVDTEEADATAKKRTRKAKPDEVKVEVVAAPEVAPAMPAPPVFDVAVNVPQPEIVAPVVANKAPFTDAAGLMEYVTTTYYQLAEKSEAVGAQIQDVLTRIGARHINEVRPDQYDALFAGVEALKAA